MRTVWLYDGIVYKSLDMCIMMGARGKRDCLCLEFNETESIEPRFENGEVILQDEEDNFMYLGLDIRSAYLSYEDEQNDTLSYWYDFSDLLPNFSSSFKKELNSVIDLASDEIHKLNLIDLD